MHVIFKFECPEEFNGTVVWHGETYSYWFQLQSLPPNFPSCCFYCREAGTTKVHIWTSKLDSYSLTKAFDTSLLKTFNTRVVEDFMVCYYSRSCFFGEVNFFPLRQLYSSQFSLWKLRIWYACLGVPFEFIHFTLIITALACCALSLSIQALSNLLFSHILHVTS